MSSLYLPAIKATPDDTCCSYETSARTARDSTTSAAVTVKKANTVSMVHLHCSAPKLPPLVLMALLDFESIGGFEAVISVTLQEFFSCHNPSQRRQREILPQVLDVDLWYCLNQSCSASGGILWACWCRISVTTCSSATGAEIQGTPVVRR
jgi:hypothetical protein